MHIIVVDDRELLNEELHVTLLALFPRADFHFPHSADVAIAMASSLSNVRLLLVDLFAPDAEGFIFLRTLCNALPDLPVVVWSSSEESVHVDKALDVGVSGYILKKYSRAEVSAALNLVMAGGVFVPETVVKPMFCSAEMQQMVLQISGSMAKLMA
jgi:DNA-binding NarL/FixJ family response regulator